MPDQPTNSDTLVRYTDDELAAELERRKKLGKARPQMRTGAHLMPAIQSMLEENMEAVEKDGFACKDIKHYLFEVAMEELYGKDVWKWYSERVKG